MQAQALLQIPKSALAANKCVMSFLGYSSEAVLRPTEPVSEREHACMYRLAQEICDHAQLPARFTERMKKMTKPVLAITMGDAAGIGAEITVKALMKPEIYTQAVPVVIGDRAAIADAIQFL